MFYLKGWDLLLFLKGPFCPRYNFSDSNSEIMLGTVRRTQIISTCTARKEYCTATIQLSHHSLRKAENWNSRDDSVCQFIIRKEILLKYFIHTVQLAVAVHKSRWKQLMPSFSRFDSVKPLKPLQLQYEMWKRLNSWSPVCCSIIFALQTKNKSTTLPLVYIAPISMVNHSPNP